VESNLFLAPGEGDATLVPSEEEKAKANGDDGVDLADTLRMVRGEIR